jgi:hypothetical protein
MINKNASPRWQLNWHDLKNIFKVLAWSTASSLVGYIIMVIPQVGIPSQYAALAAVLLPTINTTLVAAKKWTAGQAEKID